MWLAAWSAWRSLTPMISEIKQQGCSLLLTCTTTQQKQLAETTYTWKSRCSSYVVKLKNRTYLSKTGHKIKLTVYHWTGFRTSTFKEKSSPRTTAHWEHIWNFNQLSWKNITSLPFLLLNAISMWPHFKYTLDKHSALCSLLSLCWQTCHRVYRQKRPGNLNRDLCYSFRMT